MEVPILKDHCKESLTILKLYFLGLKHMEKNPGKFRPRTSGNWDFFTNILIQFFVVPETLFPLTFIQRFVYNRMGEIMKILLQNPTKVNITLYY